MKKIALAIAFVIGTTGLTFAAGQNKPATTSSTSTTKVKKHKKTKKAPKTEKSEKK